MFPLAFLNRGRCLHFFFLSFWQSRFIPQHARRSYDTHRNGKIWYLLAYTQLYHSPTSVQGNADHVVGVQRPPARPPQGLSVALASLTCSSGHRFQSRYLRCLLMHEPSVGRTVLHGSEIWDWTSKMDSYIIIIKYN